ncbi:MAG: hypothetical protein SOZ59_16250 [Candidatus Limivivens sp.]|nr:hypothetical protein [Candidatus Limivivens sp.]
MKEELKDANVIEEENLKAKKRMAKLAVKNQLYDKMQKQTSRQIILLTELISAYSLTENGKQKKKILGKVVVIGAYIKRRSNLIFIAEQNDVIPVKELELCFQETIRNLEINGVSACFSSDIKEISSESAMKIYDFYEAVIEASMDSLSALAAALRQKGEELMLSISAECREDLKETASHYGAEAEQDFDGSWLLSFLVEGGGSR